MLTGKTGIEHTEAMPENVAYKTAIEQKKNSGRKDDRRAQSAMHCSDHNEKKKSTQ